METGTTIPVAGPDDAELRRKLLLVAALPYRADPGRIAANSAKILKNALTICGRWTEQLAEEFNRFDGEPVPVWDSWYETLIEMTRQTPLLLQGFGNLGGIEHPPAHALFTACYLTERGRLVAERLLTENPQWQIP